MRRGLFVRLRTLLLAVPMLVLTAPLAAQQSATTGAFRGRVSDAEGKPVTGAQIIARNEATGVQRGAVADADGRYTIPLLQPGGPYTLRVTSIGYQDATRGDFNITAGNTITVDFRLDVQAVAVTGIEVSGAAARVDVTQAGVVTRVGTEQVENLPVAGRDFTDFLNLSPLVSPQPGIGTGGQFSVAGMRTSGTNVQIDGTDANNVYFGENRGSSRSPFAFSLESIKEFQLITNGYDVEYGSYQGGVVNAVTKGGTNDFDGTLFYFRRDKNLTGKDFSGNTPTDYNVNQFGASLSGPIIRDRLHFFASADVQRKDQPIYATVPGQGNQLTQDSINRVITALQSRYGITNASKYFGQFAQAQNNLVLFGRLDWTLNDKHRLTLRQNYSDFEQTNDRLSSTESITNTGGFLDKVYSTVAELNSVFSDRVFNTFRFQWGYEDRPRPYNEEGGYLPQLTIQRVGAQSVFFGGDGVVFRNRLEEKKLQFIDNFNYRIGSHSLKLGANVLLGSNVNTFWLNGNGVWTFNSLSDFEAGRPTSYTRNTRRCPVPLAANASGETVICPEYDVPVASFGYGEYAAYLQDDFQVSDRLMLTGGLRFTAMSFPDKPQFVQAVQDTFGLRTDNVPSFTGVSPRVSFTYDFGRAQQVLRGGAAILIGRAPTVLVGNAISTERPLLGINCTGNDVPTVNMSELLSATGGENNPAACRSGGAPTGRAEYTVFGDDFVLPKTFKSSIGYEHLFGTNTKLSLDFIYAYSWDQFTVQDLNLGARSCGNSPLNRDPENVQPCFTLANEGNRPVFATRTSFNPRNSSANMTSRLTSGAFNNVYYNVADGEARSYNATISLDQQIGQKLQAGISYAWVNAFDNSSFFCCTSGEGFTTEPVAGLSPNVVGEPGDEDALWGPSRFERRHTIVLNAIWHAPLGINLSGIFRMQSGTPFTPVVDGDVNGDGVNFNERIYLDPNTLQFRSGTNGATDRANFDLLVNKFDCLREQLGGFVKRNSCRNPWWRSLDMRVAKEFNTVRGQRVELIADLFNVLNGINSDWGRYMQYITSATNLLRAESFDATTGQVVYSVNYTPATATTPARGFGVLTPVGFDPYQFQAQLGLRYRF